jgi:hypothetical protein
MKTLRRETPYGDTIFCDDVRFEIGQKQSFIGVYQGDMIAYGAPPLVLPKLCLVVSYSERPGESLEPVELRVYMPGDADDAPTLRQQLPVDQLRSEAVAPTIPGLEDPMRKFSGVFSFSPFPITQEGTIKVRAYRGDLEVRLGTLRVQFQTSPDQKPLPDAG